MTDYKEEQEEELEVLRSIYEGDSQFAEIKENCFQYKYGTEEGKSILIEISWPELYPSVLPNISLDLFHNNYLSRDFREEIKSKLLEQGEELLDCAMTYSLFDWMNERAEDFINSIPDAVKREHIEKTDEPTKMDKLKKEQLTKAQKRRITERTNHKGERERGWDWVDVIRHLSQTGMGSAA